jgi:hypothetical protein
VESVLESVLMSPGSRPACKPRLAQGRVEGDSDLGTRFTKASNFAKASMDREGSRHRYAMARQERPKAKVRIGQSPAADSAGVTSLISFSNG